MTSIFLKKKLPKILTGILILFFFIVLFKNIDYVKFPNSDFFQYVDDGYQYLNFKLPDSIYPPPFAPLIISLFSKLFSNIEYPELFSAHLINIICATLTLLNIFLIFSKRKPWLGLLIILLTATNKIYITNSLNITNEVVFTFFLTLTLLLYSKKHYSFSYLLGGLSFLIRYEAIVLVLAIFVIDFFKKDKRVKLSHALMAIIPIIIWLVVLNFHSLGNSIFQNAYINEIIVGKNDIPNFQSFYSLIIIVLSNLLEHLFHIRYFSDSQFNFQLLITGIKYIFSGTVLLICFKNIFFKKINRISQIIYLIIPLYLIFTTFFPNFNIRYLFPIFWTIYFVLINRKNKIVVITISFILLAINLINLKTDSIYDGVFEKSEYRLVSDWINKQKFNDKTNIIFYQPFAIDYFINQSQKQKITFNDTFDTNYDILTLANKCNKNVICVLQKIYQNSKKDIFFITTSFTSTSEDQIDDVYLFQRTNMKMFQEQNLSLSDRKQLIFITELKLNNSHWAKIYQYQPSD